MLFRRLIIFEQVKYDGTLLTRMPKTFRVKNPIRTRVKNLG